MTADAEMPRPITQADVDAELRAANINSARGYVTSAIERLTAGKPKAAQTWAEFDKEDLALMPDDVRRVALDAMRAEILKADPAIQGTLSELFGIDRPIVWRTPSNRTDVANGERFAFRYGGRVRYVNAWGWLMWDGARWRRDDNGELCRMAKDTARSIYAEAQTAGTDDDAKKLAAWASVSQSMPKLDAMLKAAQSEEMIAARAGDFDRDDWLLNCANGMVDLRTGTLQRHDRDKLITKLAPVDFDPNAPCDLWRDFLFTTFGEDAELIAFVRRAVGYTLTGNTGEQCLFFCYGTGANGKSTFLETLRAALGDYGQQANAQTFLTSDRQAIRNDIAALQGARFVAAIEAGAGRQLAEVLIKQLTGGDSVRTRYLYHEEFEYKPSFKLWLAANHKPVIRGTDHAIWRRIRLIPFTVTIPDSQQDRQLAEKLRAELPGILAWAVSGCLEWQRDGLKAPTAVTNATAEYRAEQDVFAAFLADCCIMRPDAQVSASAIREAYKRWSGDDINPQRLAAILRERRYTPGKGTGGQRVWNGLGLVADGG